MTDNLKEAFRASGRRWTSQRQVVLDVLESASEHLDADMVYTRAKMHDPDISLATIYRTLAILKEMGLVEEHRLGEEHCHYEPVGDGPHYHFTCVDCGEVVEFDAPLVEQIKQEFLQKRGGRINSTHLYMSGYCARCWRRRQEETGENGGKNNDEYEDRS